jgi:hypothetical protein
MKRLLHILTIASTACLFAACASASSSPPTSGATDAAVFNTGLVRAAAAPVPIVLSPNILSFTEKNDIAPFSVSQSGFKGVFTVTVPKTCSKIVKLSQTKLSGPNANFDVKALGAGRCDLKIAGGTAQTATETIYVTTTGGKIS